MAWSNDRRTKLAFRTFIDSGCVAMGESEHVGGGLEYWFTPHIGIFGEASYNWVEGGNH